MQQGVPGPGDNRFAPQTDAAIGQHVCGYFIASFRRWTDTYRQSNRPRVDTSNIEWEDDMVYGV